MKKENASESPNENKISYRRRLARWLRGRLCGEQPACKPEPVSCIAWLGVAVISDLVVQGAVGTLWFILVASCMPEQRNLNWRVLEEAPRADKITASVLVCAGEWIVSESLAELGRVAWQMEVCEPC